RRRRVRRSAILRSRTRSSAPTTTPSPGVFSVLRSSSSTGNRSGVWITSLRWIAGWKREAGDVEHEYTLYCFAQSGNCYKVALALELAGANWTPRLVDYFGGETRMPAYREINVMGEAPVLEHRGARIAQWRVILDYVAEKFGRFGPKDGDER